LPVYIIKIIPQNAKRRKTIIYKEVWEGKKEKRAARARNWKKEEDILRGPF
jgi:hypothetical protein